MRLCKYLKTADFKILSLPLYVLIRAILVHYQYKFGIEIPPDTQIGSGFYIGHFGGIVINARSIIGNNVNISPGVVIGQSSRGKNKGYPTIGNNVYIGPGAKIIGAVYIGNNVAVGANCVVTKDIPDNAVVVGIPGKIISFDGIQEYIKHTNY
jgi:serine O-acetyltransferase